MEVKERKIGRIFQIEFHEDENLFEAFDAFVKENNIRQGSITIFGALKETDMRSGFLAILGDSARLHFNDWREFIGIGNISWPEQAPSGMDAAAWREPQPYVHIHLAISGGPYNAEVIEFV
jgi:predicted DNA-binding protein with PD1-like motif